jgi:hypothetical protein
MQERRTGGHSLDLSSYATVDLYRRNAFRLSGLPVDASLRQIRRKTGEIEAAERLGDEGLIRSDRLFPVKPQPSAEAIRTALQRLRDPNQRLLDEWFWLWSIPDVEIEGAEPADVGRAWGERAGTGMAHASTALHNLAVTAHMNVLESGPGSKSIEAAWKGVYRRWRKVIDNERCWEWLEQRVEAIADPQLKAGAVAEIRRELPSLLLDIHAGLAVSVTDWPTRTKMHVNAMRASGFDRELVDRALIGAVQGQVSRLRALGDRARDATQAREPWDEAVRSIVEESAADRKTLDLVVGLHHPVVTGVTDRLAGGLRECLIAGVNRSGAEGLNQPEDYGQAVHWLEKARSIAGDGHVRQQIEADMVTLLTNQVVVTCNAALEKPKGAKTYTIDAERRMVKRTHEPMQRLRKLDRAEYDSLCDEVAGTSFVMLIEYVNHHGPRGGDVSAALPGLRKALELAKNPELAGRISKAINDIERIRRPARPAPTPLSSPTMQQDLFLNALQAGYSRDEILDRLEASGKGNLIDQLGLRQYLEPTAQCGICGRSTYGTRSIEMEDLTSPDRRYGPVRRFHSVPCCVRCRRKPLGTRPFTFATVVMFFLLGCSGVVTRLATDTTLWGGLGEWMWGLVALALSPMLIAAPRMNRKWLLRANVLEVDRMCREGCIIVS